ncbi:MAG: hypothetical protein JWO09_2779 [Bacteroidetes bacterium]|nr:hypothetical protein [Bacteroidota bacterium]
MHEIIQHTQPITSTYIQPALEIGKEDDEHEKEANSVADKVMRMSSGNGSDAGNGISTGNKVGKMTDPTLKKLGTMHSGQPVIQKMSVHNQSGINAPASVEKGINSTKGSGQSLTQDVQEEMGAKIGTDLSNVKVHTDSNAVQMSRDISAKAFTHGNDIYFNQGQYNPSSKEGMHLLAHELTHTVQQSGQLKPKVQRVSGDGKNIHKDLGKSGYQQALTDVNISFLITKEVGRNTLEELGIKEGISSSNKISALQAGALSYSFGMLRARNEYIANNSKKDKTGDYKGIDPLVASDESSVLDALSLAARYKIIKNQYEKSDNAKFLAEKEKLVNLIITNPDMELINKRTALGMVEADPNLILDPDRQTALQGDLMKHALMFFEKMRDPLDWIVIPEKLKKAEVLMPEQFLAAVGDMTNSAGLAKSQAGVGIGYFMYSKESPDKEYTNNGVDSGPSRNSTLYKDNTINVNFQGNQAMEIRLSAYGFNETSPGVPLNKHPTKVEIKADGKVIFVGEFRRGSATRISNDPLVTFGTNDLAGTMTVILDESFRKNTISIKTSTIEAYEYDPQTAMQKMYNQRSVHEQDTDEVQVQISTTGKILIPGSSEDKKLICFIPVQPPSVDAKELFESSSFTADINYVQNADQQKRITGFAAAINEQDIKDIINGTKTLNDVFDLTGGGVNPETNVPSGTQDKNKDKKTDRFDLQDYSANGLNNLYGKDQAENFDKLRSARATLQTKAGTFKEYYEKTYSKPDELKKILEEHEAKFENAWSATIVGIEDEATMKDMPNEEVRKLLEENIIDYAAKSKAAGGKISITANTSPLGIEGGPGGKFEKNYSSVPANSETNKQLIPIMQGTPGHLGRRNNDMLSALRAADFMKYLIMQKAKQMDDHDGGAAWTDGLKNAFIKKNLFVVVNVTGEHGTIADPVPVNIYMKDIPDPVVK